jgi:hypothetical protein
MIITKLRGGLGNQLFQYAIGRQLAESQQTELRLDLSFFGQLNNETTTPRNYRLNVFNINGDLALPTDEDKILGQAWLRPFKRRLRKIGLDLFHWNYFREANFGFHPRVVNFKGAAVLEGYWQSQRYFPDIRSLLLRELTLKDEFVTEGFLAVQQEMKMAQSVAIHVRRGDYVHLAAVNRQFGTCTSEYYAEAIRFMKQKIKKPLFYVFSDELDWCRENLPFNGETVRFISGFQDYQDLLLISSCAHQIIANSSFSWWGAWLNTNPDKIVVAPKTWFANSDLDTRNVVPAAWIRL